MRAARPVVALTLAADGFAGLSELLEAEGCEVRSMPLLRFAPPPDWRSVDGALARLAAYHAVALTSPRAASAVACRAAAAPLGRVTVPVWATGAATAVALGSVLGMVRRPEKRFGADAGGDTAAGAALARAMLAAGTRPPVLYFCGDARRDELPAGLRAAGLTVDEIVCYRSLLAEPGMARRAARGASALVVSSPRVAQLLARTVDATERPRLVAIGPTTAAAAEVAGWPADAVAQNVTAASVADAVRSLLKLFEAR
ncbi:MAG TPA: uroporphyrinogen-III synthase [Gemmatimonadales bacterium]|nr:uroporphyrinogen-III synthase [Gemmatimonadales bacterium]